MNRRHFCFRKITSFSTKTGTGVVVGRAVFLFSEEPTPLLTSYHIATKCPYGLCALSFLSTMAVQIWPFLGMRAFYIRSASFWSKRGRDRIHNLQLRSRLVPSVKNEEIIVLARDFIVKVCIVLQAVLSRNLVVRFEGQCRRILRYNGAAVLDNWLLSHS